ncbi:3'-5' exonuclease family protein [Snodgrassella communis]|uniref:3'-5' exonuclease family protein n=1 Tax=Snodgrassella communis TaxID=2946699 RepID=UPI00286D1331|nr:exonuclease domain-containing protein [Snodgrassella communis]WMY92477.1 exonuclease domain-containing protein [Snodgrassella communis]
MLSDQQLAFVDIETTGGRTTSDRITEIAVVYTEAGQQQPQVFHTLLNPNTSIPPFIQALTGISNQMVEQAPHFNDEIADQLSAIFKGRIFAAHNVRFDYGFIKAAFKRLGRTFNPQQLCTVKLSRQLYPEHKHHGLDKIIARHNIDMHNRHRAFADARAIYDFWQQLKHNFPADILHQACKTIMQRPSLPTHLNNDILKNISDDYGVYLIYGDNDLPLYIGKSKQVKTRLLSHFGQDVHNSKEMSLSQQAKKIDVIPCSGELDALLTESAQIKQRQPILNRRLRRQKDLFSFQISTNTHGYDTLNIVPMHHVQFNQQQRYYGLFHSKSDAQKAIKSIISNTDLCLQTLGIEKGSSNRPCFRHQLHQCSGACINKITATTHNLKLALALQKIKLADWPFTSYAYIKEQQKYHIFHQWIYLGSASNNDQLHTILSQPQGQLDRDIYQIIQQHKHRLQALNPTHVCPD